MSRFKLYRVFIAVAVFIAFFVFSAPSQATCINPVGDHGDMLYNRDHTVMQYCNGTYWISMDASKSGGSDNLGNHTATKDLDMATFKIKNVAIPTSSADATNKAYVDAAVASAAGSSGGAFVLPDFYQTPATYDGVTAELAACSSGYRMCGVGEWAGRPYNYNLGAGPEMSYRSWIRGSTLAYSCGNYTNLSLRGLTVQTVINPTSSDTYHSYADCTNLNRVLCCKIYDLAATGGNCTENGLCFSMIANGAAYWGDTAYTNKVLPNNFLGNAAVTLTSVNGQFQTTTPGGATSAWTTSGTMNARDKIQLRAVLGPGTDKLSLAIAGKNYTWEVPGAIPKTVSMDNTYVYTATTKITGVSGSTPAIISSSSATAHFRVNGGSWVNTGSVEPGDTIQLRAQRGAAADDIVFSYGPISQIWKVPPSTAMPAFIAIEHSPGYPNLGGLAGANNRCLTALRSGNWRNKSSYNLNESTVKAFLCDSSTCQNLEPNLTYVMASSSNGNAPVGGDTFTTDSQGRGPNNALTWFSQTALGTAYNYLWTGRAAGTATVWANTPSPYTCNDWTTTGSGSATAGYKNTSITDSKRWSYSQYSCDSYYPLICTVLPY